MLIQVNDEKVELTKDFVNGVCGDNAEAVLNDAVHEVYFKGIVKKKNTYITQTQSYVLRERLFIKFSYINLMVSLTWKNGGKFVECILGRGSFVEDGFYSAIGETEGIALAKAALLMYIGEVVDKAA